MRSNEVRSLRRVVRSLSSFSSQYLLFLVINLTKILYLATM
ncbi:hypothetical protein [Nostoc sp. TCL240-02]|nr:hypothetical protein [Nostoc sp. TCL240-02]